MDALLLLGTFVAILAFAGVGQFGTAVNDWYSAMADAVKSGNDRSNCSAQGMVSFEGKCHGG